MHGFHHCYSLLSLSLNLSSGFLFLTLTFTDCLILCNCCRQELLTLLNSQQRWSPRFLKVHSSSFIHILFSSLAPAHPPRTSSPLTFLLCPPCFLSFWSYPSVKSFSLVISFSPTAWTLRPRSVSALWTIPLVFICCLSEWSSWCQH